MFAICVDDERLPLQALERALTRSPDIDGVAAFEDERDALDWARGHAFDVAFLDIELHEMSGIELAEALAKINPRVSVVFCTGYERYAVQAVRLHMDVGYLLKPFRPDEVRRELDYIQSKRRGAKLLTAVCFGAFEVYREGAPLQFARRKTRELLALLIDRRGAVASADELCALLWENAGDAARQRDYLYHLIADLKRTLKEAGAESVLVSLNRGYAVDTGKIDCDYYRLLEGDTDARAAFTGEYLGRYSWAEPRAAWLAASFPVEGGSKGR